MVLCTPRLSYVAARLSQVAFGDECRGYRAFKHVGKPMSQLLSASCTVTIAHSRTKDLPDVVRRADIVVAAVGRPDMVKGDWIKPATGLTGHQQD